MKRECGGCTQCCKTIGVAELKKSREVWCDHCDRGKGCSIYFARPKSCIEFECLWLQGVGTDNMRPDKSKIVMLSTLDGKDLVMYLDPSRPLAYMDRKFDLVIKNLLKRGINVILVTGEKRKLLKHA